MPLPRRRSRLVHVQDVAYRWLVSPHWQSDVNGHGERWHRSICFLDLYVERRLHSTNQLRVRLNAERLRAWGRNPEERTSIDPPLVRRAVRYALSRGWLPETPHTPHFALDPFAQRFLQTPRHLLYAEPVIARVRLSQIQGDGVGCTTAEAQIQEVFRGEDLLSTPTLPIRVHQPAQHLPDEGVMFLHPHPDPTQAAWTDWPRLGGLFRVAAEAVFLYDNSGEEHRWAFLSLRELRRELAEIHDPLLDDSPEDTTPFQDTDAEE